MKTLSLTGLFDRVRRADLGIAVTALIGLFGAWMASSLVLAAGYFALPPASVGLSAVRWVGFPINFVSAIGSLAILTWVAMVAVARLLGVLIPARAQTANG